MASGNDSKARREAFEAATATDWTGTADRNHLIARGLAGDPAPESFIERTFLVTVTVSDQREFEDTDLIDALARGGLLPPAVYLTVERAEHLIERPDVCSSCGNDWEPGHENEHLSSQDARPVVGP